MGNALETLSPMRGVKRSREDLEENQEDNGHPSPETPRDFRTPKRKRSQSTAKYILKTLFEEGTESDITIIASGHEWRLHKLYLCQCRYFDSMFNGPWKEAEQSVVNMEITDENIDHKALKIAFQSLYTDNVFVKPAEAVGVLAAATLLQLDPLIEHCKTVMKGCVAPDTVCTFYKASERYGLVEIKDICLKWLQHCLMVPGYAMLICHIPEDLLLTLLNSSDLWLMQVEVDIYTLLKKWMFVQLNPSWNGSREQLYADSEDYFKRRAKQDGNSCFLETETGQRFIHMFKKIRWMYVVNDLSSIQLIRDDRILPLSWLEPFISHCWTHHLMIEQAIDKGPQQVSEEEFLEKSMRCGRILLQEQDYCWRWVGYNFGLDLLITCRNRVLMIKRNGGSQHFEGLISQQNQRHVMLRLSLATIRKMDPSPAVTSTGIKMLALNPDEEVMLMQMGSDIKFPLQVTMNLLFITPSNSLPVPSLAVPPPPVVCVPSPSSSSTNMTPSATVISSSSTVDGAASTERKSTPGTSESDCSSVQSGSKGSESNCSSITNRHAEAHTSNTSSRQSSGESFIRRRFRSRSGELPSRRGNSGTSRLEPHCEGVIASSQSQSSEANELPSFSAPAPPNSAASSSAALPSSPSADQHAFRSAVAQLRDIRERESQQQAASCSVSPASHEPPAASAVAHLPAANSSAQRCVSKPASRRRSTNSATAAPS